MQCRLRSHTQLYLHKMDKKHNIKYFGIVHADESIDEMASGHWTPHSITNASAYSIRMIWGDAAIWFVGHNIGAGISQRTQWRHRKCRNSKYDDGKRCTIAAQRMPARKSKIEMAVRGHQLGASAFLPVSQSWLWKTLPHQIWRSYKIWRVGRSPSWLIK